MPGAVFLSYASQDVEAAKRICERLQAAGVEVWFDQSELTGGDAWDAKIRKQIRECGLFIPLISANTQSRLEGYFRIEWKLAAQRTHAMAEAKAFLLPVVIDGTGDADAHVPAEFKDVQWTRPRSDKELEAFSRRVGVLAGVVEASGAGIPARIAREVRSAPPKRSGGIILAVGAIALVAITVAIMQWTGKKVSTQTPPPVAEKEVAPEPTAPPPAAVVTVAPAPAPAPVPVLPVRRYVETLPVNQAQALALSADGKTVVFTGNGTLYRHDFTQLGSSPIPVNDRVSLPFISPDGKTVGYAAILGQGISELRTVPLNGGASVPIPGANGQHISSPVWAADDSLVFDLYPSQSRYGLMRIPVAGGTAEPVTRLAGDESYHAHPELLPGAEYALFSVFRAGSGRNPVVPVAAGETAQLAVATLKTGAYRLLGVQGFMPRYLPSGHIAFARADGSLWVVPFDLAQREITGQPVFVMSGLRVMPPGSVRFAVSREGTLIYQTGNSAYTYRLSWTSRDGTRSEEAGAEAELLGSIELSPDGREVLYTTAPNAGQSSRDIWRFNLETGVRTPLASGPDAELFPRWAADGKEVAYHTLPANRGSMPPTGVYPGSRALIRLADGSDAPREVSAALEDSRVGGMTPDGRYLIFTRGGDIFHLVRNSAGSGWESEPRPFLQAAGIQQMPSLSPNGRYVAYLSDESGRSEVYVREFPAGVREWLISSAGAGPILPRWSRDGRELFYVQGVAILVIPVTTEGGFTKGAPQRLFSMPALPAGAPSFDISPDGRRFLIAEGPPANEMDKLRVVQNWLEDVKRLAPSGK